MFCVPIVAFRREAWSPPSSLRVGTGVKPGGFPSQTRTLAKSTFSEGNLRTSGRTPPKYSLFKLQPQFTVVYKRLFNTDHYNVREVGDSISFPVSQSSLGNLDWGADTQKRRGSVAAITDRILRSLLGVVLATLRPTSADLSRVYPNSNRKACSCSARTLC